MVTRPPAPIQRREGRMSTRATLRVVELTESVAGAACGRLFAAHGHEVILCEPRTGHRLRAHEFTFTALNSGKRSVMRDPVLDREAWNALLADADVLITDSTSAAAEASDLTARQLRERFPHLVTVAVTAFGLASALDEVPGDSLLAEAFGGLAHMIGEPDR